MLPKLQETVMWFIARQEPRCSAIDVQRELSRLTNREQPFGPVITTLDRLVGMNLVSWELGEPDPGQGGRAPRLYKLTAHGRRALVISHRAARALAG